MSEGSVAERGRTTLRALIDDARSSHRPLVVPGCSDALGARLVELAGFDAVYLTGFGASATLLGQPDVGLLGLAEMADVAARIADVVRIPVIADADTGYGNALNVMRTVREYERAGVAALHIEDQVMPKRCGHLDAKQVIDAGEMNGKIRAAISARSGDLVVIARTDARQPLGFDEARRRAHGFVEAGADVVFVEALETRDEIEVIASEFAGVPLLFNDVPGGRTPRMSPPEIADLGFAVRLLPVDLLFVATAAMQHRLAELRVDGAVDPPPLRLDEFTELIGLPEVERIARRFDGAQPSDER